MMERLKRSFPLLLIVSAAIAVGAVSGTVAAVRGNRPDRATPVLFQQPAPADARSITLNEALAKAESALKSIGGDWRFVSAASVAGVGTSTAGEGADGRHAGWVVTATSDSRAVTLRVVGGRVTEALQPLTTDGQAYVPDGGTMEHPGIDSPEAVAKALAAQPGLSPASAGSKAAGLQIAVFREPGTGVTVISVTGRIAGQAAR